MTASQFLRAVQDVLPIPEGSPTIAQRFNGVSTLGPQFQRYPSPEGTVEFAPRFLRASSSKPSPTVNSPLTAQAPLFGN